MVETMRARNWLGRIAWFCVAAILVFLSLLPINPVPSSWVWPDFLVVMTFAWVIRRPAQVPVWLIAGTFLCADFLLQQPPGLWAALVVLGTEFLRSRETQLRDAPFVLEWSIVAGVICALMLIDRLVLSLFLVEQASLRIALSRCASTVLAYPLAVFAARFIFGLRKLAPGEVDILGRRL